ncbi:MAG TPA: response regulator [Polyangiaceae bacterium]|nr:response regulator [Polyangiaceae bacterium]
MPLSGAPDTSSSTAVDRRRILFVDDDALILRGISRSLRSAEPSWEILLCEDPAKALALLERERVDVVVSDLNMKELDGAALLGDVQAKHPEIVRVVLSAMVDSQLVFRTVPIAHQFVTKPFEVADLRARLRSALELGKLLQDTALRALVAGNNTLPVVPRTFSELCSLVTDPKANVADMAAVVERDPALSAELVRLVSSAFFGLPRQIHGVRGAIAYLGVEMLKALVLGVEVVRAFGPEDCPPGFDLEEIQAHSLLVARAARRLATGTRFTDDAFTAGILHDIGQLVLASRAPARFAEALALSESHGVPLEDAEREILGTTHARVGAYLLGLWGVKESLVNAVLLHHDAEAGAEFGVASIVAEAESQCRAPATASGDRPRSTPASGTAKAGTSRPALARTGGSR